MEDRPGETARQAAPNFGLVALVAPPGLGKTTVLRQAHARLGGALLGAADLQGASSEARHPVALEDAFYALIDGALKTNPVVLLDDMHLLSEVVEGCHMYPRGGFINVALTAVARPGSARGDPSRPVRWTS